MPRPDWTTVLTWLVVVPGLAYTWFAWTVSCSLREGERVTWWNVCDTDWAYVPWLSFVAVRVVIAAWVHYRSTRRLWVLILAVIVGVAAGSPAWIAYGDPSGNFEGLRTD